METLDGPAVRTILATLLDLLADAPPVRVRLVGTAAALVQGVDLPVGDVDVLVADRAGVDAIAAALAGAPCSDPPVWIPQSHQYFTRFQLHGGTVEFSTVEGTVPDDGHEGPGRGPWDHWTPAPIGDGRTFPAVALELRLVTELLRNRPDRITPLLTHLRTHGANRPLLTRAMTARAIPQPRRTAILRALG